MSTLLVAEIKMAAIFLFLVLQTYVQKYDFWEVLDKTKYLLRKAKLEFVIKQDNKVVESAIATKLLTVLTVFIELSSYVTFLFVKPVKPDQVVKTGC